MDNIKIKITNNQSIAKIANELKSEKDNVYFNLRQIINYDWFSDELVSECIKMFDIHVKNLTNFEELLHTRFRWNDSDVDIDGIIDARLSDKCIWEFKCVNEITMTHKLQLLVYAFLWENSYYMYEDILCKKIPKWGDDEKFKGYYNINSEKIEYKLSDSMKLTNMQYKLFNCRTGDIWELNYDNAIINEIMDILLQNSYLKIEYDDTNFIEKCHEPFKSISNNFEIRQPNKTVEIQKIDIKIQKIDINILNTKPILDLKKLCGMYSKFIISGSEIIYINENTIDIDYIKIHYSKNNKEELLAICKNKNIIVLNKNKTIKSLNSYKKSALIDLIIENSTDDEMHAITKTILIELLN